MTDDRAEMTNLDWVIDARDISSVTGSAKVGVINDLQAQGHSLHMLDENDTRCVLAGTHQVRDNDTKIVIGMGTGFNAAPCFTHLLGDMCPHLKSDTPALQPQMQNSRGCCPYPRHRRFCIKRTSSGWRGIRTDRSRAKQPSGSHRGPDYGRGRQWR